MKYAIYIITAMILLAACQEKINTANKSTGSYDSTLASELEADDYGMKQYVMAFLKRGPNPATNHDSAATLQKAHLENITRMAEEGVLVLAGPFLDKGEIRGIYIFDVTTIEEAEKLTATDPAIQHGQLEMELHPWYGSAALMKINEIHRTINRKSITD